MADYRDLFWQVRTELPGVPVPLLFSNYANAVREFFSKSKAWQHNVPSLLDLGASPTAFPTITAGVEIPAATYVVEPVKVKWSDGQTLLFKTRDQLDDIDGDWEQSTAGKPTYWTITSPGVWSVVPLLTAAVTAKVQLRLAIAPVLTMAASAISVPDYLADEFSEVWAHGALSKLMKIPGKDWTNVKLAAEYGIMFDRGVRMAKSRAAADFGRPKRQVMYGGLGIGGSHENLSNDYGN